MRNIGTLDRIPPFLGLLGGFTLFWWGLWVSLPWDAFSRGPQYDLLAHLASEPVWGFIAMVLGGWQIISSWRVRAEHIRLSCLGAFYFWGLLVMSYVYSDWRHLAVIMASHMVLINGWAYLNLSQRKTRGWLNENS